MKVRHINNIIIELEEYEVRPIIDALTDALTQGRCQTGNGKGYRYSNQAIIIIDKLRDGLQKLTEREA